MPYFGEWVRCEDGLLADPKLRRLAVRAIIRSGRWISKKSGLDWKNRELLFLPHRMSNEGVFFDYISA